MDLFSSQINSAPQPLSEKMRPKSLDDMIGQEHLLSDSKPLGQFLRSGQLMNLILTGPPGTGKTSFAMALSRQSKAHVVQMNAVDAGVKDIKQAGEDGKNRLLQNHEKTLLFVDEIHRFNKSQQDVLLPLMEKGYLYLIGATTENPAYSLNRALLSRARVVQFKPLTSFDLKKLALKAFQFSEIKQEDILSEQQLNKLLDLADGDGRRILNWLESIFAVYKYNPKRFPLEEENLKEFLESPILAYDRQSDQHYDHISAFIKSIRGSDADAAMYYMVRMLEGGEDPLFIARRMIILASEDVGNAEPRALPLAIAGLHAVESIGLPEAAINLAQVVTFLASSPKSNRSYNALNKAKEFVSSLEGSPAVPPHLKSSGLGKKDYRYPHNSPTGYLKQNYWPESLTPQNFYQPSTRGFEKSILEYQKWLKGESIPETQNQTESGSESTSSI